MAKWGVVQTRLPRPIHSRPRDIHLRHAVTPRLSLFSTNFLWIQELGNKMQDISRLCVGGRVTALGLLAPGLPP